MAAEKFLQIPEATRTGWTQFNVMRAALLGKFVDDAHSYACATKLFHRKFEVNESIFQFAQALLRLAQGAYGQEKAAAMRNDVLKDIFLWGLPSHLSTRLYIDYPKTWDEAVAAAERLADATAQCTSAATNLCTDLAPSSVVNLPSSNDPIMLAIFQQNQQLLKNTNRGKQSKQQRNFRGNPYSSQQQTNRPYCNYCNNSGHHWGNCYKRQAEQGGRFQNRSFGQGPSRRFQGRGFGPQGRVQFWQPQQFQQNRFSSYLVEEPYSYEETCAISPYEHPAMRQSYTTPRVEQSSVSASDYERKCTENDLLLEQNRQLQASLQRLQSNKASVNSTGNPFVTAEMSHGSGAYMVQSEEESEGEWAEKMSRDLVELLPSTPLHCYMAEGENLSPSAPPFNPTEWQGLSEDSSSDKASSLAELDEQSIANIVPVFEVEKPAVPQTTLTPVTPVSATSLLATPTLQPSLQVPVTTSVSYFRGQGGHMQPCPLPPGPCPVPLMSVQPGMPISSGEGPLFLNQTKKTPLLPRPKHPPVRFGQVRPLGPPFLGSPQLRVPNAQSAHHPLMQPFGSQRSSSSTTNLLWHSLFIVAILTLLFSFCCPAADAQQMKVQQTRDHMDPVFQLASKSEQHHRTFSVHPAKADWSMGPGTPGISLPLVELGPVSLPVFLFYLLSCKLSCTGLLSEIFGLMFLFLFVCGPLADFWYDFSVFSSSVRVFLKSLPKHIAYLLGVPVKFLVKVQVSKRTVVALLDCGSTIYILRASFANTLPEIKLEPPEHNLVIRLVVITSIFKLLLGYLFDLDTIVSCKNAKL